MTPMEWFREYIQALDDAFALPELDYPTYCILREAAIKLRRLHHQR